MSTGPHLGWWIIGTVALLALAGVPIATTIAVLFWLLFATAVYLACSEFVRNARGGDRD